MASASSPVRNVRTILRLEARARRLLARYERALTAATRAKGQAHLLLDEADGLERALSDAQLRELHQARARAASVTTTTGTSTLDPAPAPAPDGGQS